MNIEHEILQKDDVICYSVFQKFIELSGEGIAWADLDANITFSNQKLCDMFGEKSPNDLNGKPVFQYYPKEMQDKIRDEVLPQVLKRGYWDGELIILSDSGETFHTENHLFLLTDDEGDPLYYANRLVDITDRKKSLKEAEQFSEEIMRSNKDLEQFAYAISHDLQEPLRTINSYCQLLEEDFDCLPEDKKKRFINNISESTTRMTFLIKDLLDFSRVNATNALNKEEVDLEKIIEEEVENFSVIIKETEAEINYSNMPNIKSVEVLMRQLFHNLISNSLKFRSNNKPIIDISCCSLKGEWLFMFRDNGIGIDKKYYDRIFGVFKRIHTDKEYKGTGIGLAICEKIINNLGGKIWLESEHNKGTIFYFTIKKHDI